MWRQGRRNLRTIYILSGEQPSDDDRFIGALDDPSLTRLAVVAANTLLIKQRLQQQAVVDEAQGALEAIGGGEGAKGS